MPTSWLQRRVRLHTDLAIETMPADAARRGALRWSPCSRSDSANLRIHASAAYAALPTWRAKPLVDLKASAAGAQVEL